VSSEEGVGTTFRVYLPMAPLSEIDAVMPKAVGAPHVARGEEVILLVEDEASVRNFLRSVLLRDGYRVIEAEDGKQAIGVAQRHDGTIHLLLTDLMMANMGGKELARRMVELRPGIRVLFMSGYAEEVVLQQGELLDGARFLQKPFSPDILARKVREILDGVPSSIGKVIISAAPR
jgi:CheY-like chemotaxis protein